MDYKFKRKRVDALTESKMMFELEKVAKHFNYIEFGWRDFNSVAEITANPIKKYFGSWRKAIEALRRQLRQKDIILNPRPYSPNRKYSNEDLFNEMERIWQTIGQRPSRNEWEICNPNIAYITYKQRFGSWTQACLKFIEYKMGDLINRNDFVVSSQEVKTLSNQDEYKQAVSRSVPLRLRFEVLKRDNYRCVYCGKSPVTDIGTILHIDHKTPFSKGGKSTLENLQTLCEDCNLGKSDKT